jgi:hypothetical protein
MPLFLAKLLFLFSIVTFTNGQLDSGYDGYSLSSSGDPESAIYSSSSTPSNATTFGPPDVFLNASVHVGEIGITVENLTAKINVDAQVLNLLKFNAGVDLSIDRVRLSIREVDAQVQLQARLGNLVLMIDDVLDSIDLNPILAELGQSVGEIVNSTTGVLTGATALVARDTPVSYRLKNNVLYSINDYSGHAHTNRVLAQTGDIVDQSLDNSGNVQDIQVVGSYEETMTFSGQNRSVVFEGEIAWELEYSYEPFPGLSRISAVYVNLAGEVIGTQVLSESGGGGGSTIGKN